MGCALDSDSSSPFRFRNRYGLWKVQIWNARPDLHRDISYFQRFIVLLLPGPGIAPPEAGQPMDGCAFGEEVRSMHVTTHVQAGARASIIDTG